MQAPVSTVAGTSLREPRAHVAPAREFAHAAEPMGSLFRPEVAEAQRQNWLGQVQLVRPLSLTAVHRRRAVHAGAGAGLPVLRRVHAQGAHRRRAGARPGRDPPGAAGAGARARAPCARGPGGARRRGDVRAGAGEQHAVHRRAGARAAQPGRAPAQPGRGRAPAGAAGRRRDAVAAAPARRDEARAATRSRPRPRCTGSAWRWRSSRWSGSNR